MGKPDEYTREEFYKIYPYLGVLEDAVRSLPDDAVIAELGCWSGKATASMLLGAKSGHKIFAIDNFGGSQNAVEAEHFVRYRETLQKKGYSGPKDLFLQTVSGAPTKGRCFLLETDFDLAAPNFDAESIDMVFIDGNHFQTMHDLLVWVPRVKAGGLVFCHDVDKQHYTVGEEFVTFCEYHGFDWNMDGELGCFRK